MSDVVVNITPPAPISLAYTQGGAVGPQGAVGPAGPENKIVIGQVVSGTAVSATISAQTVANGTATQTLSFVLQRGETGSQGIQGEVGPAGPPNVLTVGTVATTSATTASVSITGNSPSQQISFVVPRGPQGEVGPYTSIQAGTVTTGDAGTSAKVDAVTSGNTVTLNFTIPRGVPGSVNLADETPQPLGTASAGVALSAARADHIHATLASFPYGSLTGVPTTFAPSAHTHTVSAVSGLQELLDGKQTAGSYAPLVNNLVPSAFLPGFVDDVVDAGETLPASGDVGKIYVVSTGANVNKIYRWSGSTFVEISPSPGSTDAVPEGSVNLYHTTGRAAAAAPVQSVAGRTGTITLTYSDIGGTPPVATTKALGAVIVGSGLTITDGVLAATGGGGAASVSYDYATTADLPATGNSSLLHCTTDTGRLWRWTGSVYAEVGPIGGGGSAAGGTDGGFFAGEAAPQQAISITQQPANQTAAAGGATFSVTATVSPSGTPTYQWQRSTDGGATWTAISGATSSSLSLTGLMSGDSGNRYRVVVSSTLAANVTSNYATLTVGSSDEFASSVSLLLHCDGSDNSTSFVDSSLNQFPVTTNGNAKVSSTAKYGTGSLALDGTGDYLSVPANPAFAFGTGNFTVEFWIRLSASSDRVGVSTGGQYTNFDCFLSGNVPSFWAGISGVVQTFGSALSTDTWHHVAWCRSSGQLRVFVNGSQVGSTLTMTDSLANTASLNIGATSYYPDSTAAYMDEIRITKDARYTTTFTPAAAAFPNP